MDEVRFLGVLVMVGALTWLTLAVIREWWQSSSRDFDRCVEQTLAITDADQRNRDLDDGIAAFDAEGVTR